MSSSPIGRDGIIDVDLADVPVLEACSVEDRHRLAARLTAIDYCAGDVILREGDTASSFVIVLSGQAAVTRQQAGHAEQLATIGPGSVLGELALLLARPRGASVTALTHMSGLTGDRSTLEAITECPSARARLAQLAASRLARAAEPVWCTLPDGSAASLRPLLPSDRAALTHGIANLSTQSLRRRFFSVVPASARLVDYLVDIDYVDHFAWVLAGKDEPPSAVARYVRSDRDSSRAELAFGVADSVQGRGVGTVLLGALGVAAVAAGVTEFTAEVLRENAPMLAVLRKASASFARSEPGVLTAHLSAAAAAEILAPDVRQELSVVVDGIVTAAGLALACD